MRPRSRPIVSATRSWSVARFPLAFQGGLTWSDPFIDEFVVLGISEWPATPPVRHHFAGPSARGDPLLILSLQKSASSTMRQRALSASRPALLLSGASGQQN